MSRDSPSVCRTADATVRVRDVWGRTDSYSSSPNFLVHDLARKPKKTRETDD